MDTNSFNAIITALAQNQPRPSDVVVGLELVLKALAPVLAALAAYFARQTLSTTKEVHVAVNSERTAMIAEVKALRDEILDISKEKSTLEENARGKQVAADVKVAKPKS
jgi:hypothetical protein